MHVENGETMGFLMLLDLISVVMSEKHFRKGALVIEKYTIQWTILFYSILWINSEAKCPLFLCAQITKKIKRSNSRSRP